MSQLAQLLQFLDRGDVVEIVVQTDKPPSAKVGDDFRPLSRNPVTTEQIEALVEGSPLASVLPRGDGSAPSQRVVVLGKPYTVRAARRGDVVQMRIERPSTEIAGERPSQAATPHPAPVAARGRPSTAGRYVATVEAEQPIPIETPAPAARKRPSAVGRYVATAEAEQPIPIETPAPAARKRPSAVGRYVATAEAEQPIPIERPASPAARDRPPAVGRHAPSNEAERPPAVGRHTPSNEAERPPAPKTTATGAKRPVPRSLASILADARDRRASDVHVVAERPVQVRRVGELVSSGEPLPASAVSEMLLALLAPAHESALAERGYVDLSVEIPDAGRLRVNVSRQRSGLKGSFRLVLSPLPTLESLGLPQELAKVTSYHQGLVVISGPNGHGKTTTLAAIIDIINATKAHHILTIEDPVEFLHPRKKAVVSQREVGSHTRSFATALKASLREDPDVIVIGELRDRETVEIAIAAAETGHLVIATMSTPSGAKTIDRLIDFFPPADQQQVRSTLAGALKFVVAQRLLPSVSGDTFVAAVELITGTPPLWSLIRDNKLFHLPNLQQRGRAFGMIRFDDSIAELLRQGEISEEVALRNAENRRELANNLRAAAPAAAAPAAPPAGAGSSQTLTGLAARVSKGLFGK